MNKIIFCGRLTKDPEKRYINDTVIARFGFAVDRKLKKEGQPSADFFNCVAFNKVVEIFEKCHVGKGTKLLLECEARNNNWEDAEGKKHYDIDFVVNSFEFCESKGGGAGTGTNNAQVPERPYETAEELDEEDLPF